MNATLARDTRPHDQHQHHEQRTPPARRVGLADRAALQLGVALIKWGRRPVAAQDFERRATRVERAIARRHRDAHVAAARESAQLNYALMQRMR